MNFFYYLFWFSQFFDIQSISKDYTISGSIQNVDNGIIYLVPAISDSNYYKGNFYIDSSVIHKGNFNFRRKNIDLGIYPYRMVIKSSKLNGTTDFIFLSNNDQTIFIDSLDEHIAPIMSNSKVQHEMRFIYNSFFKNFVTDVEKDFHYEDSVFSIYGDSLPAPILNAINLSRNAMSQTSDSLFAAYAKLYPNSDVTLWKLIERFKNWGYNIEYQLIAESFLKKGENGSVVANFINELNSSKVLDIGEPFPGIPTKNIKEQAVITHKGFFGSSYTLVDFWFTACSPCRKQFPEYKRLQNKYKSSGFQIIGISTDDQSKLKQWQNLIKSDSLNWIQFIDIGAVQSEKLGINAFPTNYLLNANGRIIRKNISINDLETLLRDNEMKLFYDNTFSREPI